MLCLRGDSHLVVLRAAAYCAYRLLFRMPYELTKRVPPSLKCRLVDACLDALDKHPMQVR